MELIQTLKRLSRADKYPFHMPGHKNILPELFADYDPTELPGLDNLHCPQDVLARAQARVADIYRVARTYFLVNGSSVGIMAALTSTLSPEDLVLVPRSCHKAVVAGLIHSGAMPLWLEQEFCPGLHHWLPPGRDQVAGLLAAHSIRAAIFTSPDYFGFVPDLPELVKLCRQSGAAVIVDEAHGAHLTFGRKLGLPSSAVEAGCDIIVQSPHKTLPALTQAAWLHLKDAGLADRLQENLNLFHTTSPSYLLLASLEYAGALARGQGYSLLRRLAVWVKILELRARQFELWRWPQVKIGRDWTKFTLVKRAGMEDLLRRAGIFPELVQGDKILFMLTMADALNPAGLHALYKVLPALAQLPEAPEGGITPPPAPVQECTPREAWLRAGQRVPIVKALGRIARQVVAPYPPGTMVVAPGQRLTAADIQYLSELAKGKVIPEWIEVI